MSNQSGWIAVGGVPAFVSAPNETMDGDGFHVSYNNRDEAIYGCDTTALVLGQMQRFYILDGDHRAAYAPLIPQGWDSCMEYFLANIDRMNKISDVPEAAGPRP